jgi:diguanylate cyclase (GGDEF)-like protein/PAS domain S-box-containing protein
MLNRKFSQGAAALLTVLQKSSRKDLFQMKSEQNKETTRISQLDEKKHTIEMYFHAINNSTDSIFVKDQEFRFVLVNDVFCSISGLSRRQIIGTTLAGKLTPSEMEHFFSIDRQVLDTGTEILCEELLTASDGGETKTVSTRKNRFIDSKGDYYIVGVVTDISEKRQLEQEKSDALKEKGRRADELVIAEEDKGKRADELVIAEKEKGKRADELVIANKELAFQNKEKDKRADELIIANKEKDKRADELVIANHKLFLQNQENEHLLKKLKRAASVFTSANESIIITDANGIIVEVNEAFSRITGYAAQDVLGKNPRFLQSDRQSPEFYTEMWDRLLAKGTWRGEIWSRRKSGEIYAEMMAISIVKNATGVLQHSISLGTDITELKNYQSQLEQIAHFDILTNLPNRVLLADRLSQAMVHCQRNNLKLAVAFMDLDGFKEVNDKYGHNVGDELLIALSQRMKAGLRDGDTLARIGGDEFIAVMVDLEKIEDSAPLLERLLTAVATPIEFDDAVLKVSASIGVSIYPQDGSDADQLIRHADQAMYVAKQEGEDRYRLFDNALANAVKAQLQNIDDIRSGMDKCEFLLHYQPKVNMHTGEVIGVEALIRWQHAVRGLVPPLEFLPAIEGRAISLKLGEWVIDNALTQIKQWQSMGLSMPISVNISAYQLQQDNFKTRLAGLLSAHPEVNPSHLELEILETSALENISKVSVTMHACKEFGVSFALDDFGTGYSSLTYLKHLPVRLIKIDQSFVYGMLEDNDDLAIVKGVVGLAKAFQRDVIAEGVESIAHGVALLKIGCELAQGYAIARPMHADDIPGWFANWQIDDSWQA